MGKPKHSDDPRGEQKGAQAHGEGQHGPKAYEARKAEISDHGQERGGQLGRSERAEHDPRAGDGSDAALHEHKLAAPHQDATAATACSRTGCSTTRPRRTARRTGR
jgi:hypothetical protein